MERFIKYKPNFEKGIIIKSVKLNQLMEYAFDLPNLTYSGYTNGVVSGFEILVEESSIVISSGVFCFNGEIYTLNESTNIPYSPTNQWRYLKLCQLDTLVKTDGIENHFAITLKETVPKENEMELCRFKLQNGANLRYVYDDFEDMNTEFDTVNLLYAPYASKEQTGLHPKILKNFAREMLDLKPENMIDTFFCLQVLGLNTVMNTEEVVRYVELRTEEKLEKITNYKLYRKLLEILQQEKAKTKVVKKKPIQQRKIIVD